MTRSKFKIKVLYLKIGLLVMSFVLAFFLAEFFLRLFTPEPENLAKLKSSNLFLHENKPNATFPYASTGEFNNQITLNSYGFRDEEFSQGKGEGVLRIAVLGDSQEEALQVELSDTWPKVMARRLSAEIGRQVETYSFGVSGYGTDQEWLTLREKVWQFGPDFVILAFSPNDVGDVYKNGIVEIVDGKLAVKSIKDRSGGNWLGRILRETYSYHLAVRALSAGEFGKKVAEKIRTKVLGFPKEDRFFLSDAQLVEGPFEVMASKKQPPKEVLDSWSVVSALVSDMNRQSGENGAKFMVVVNIPRAQVEEEHWEVLKKQYFLSDETASPHQINDVMGEICKELGVSYYDGRLDAVEWTEKRGILHFKNDAHFNLNGNVFMGTGVADFILENKLIN